jgi:hypothetical protein
MFRNQNSVAEQHSARSSTLRSSRLDQSQKESKLSKSDLQIVMNAPSVQNPFPWLRNQSIIESRSSMEERAVSLFFSNFVLAACNHGATLGYLVDLPHRYYCTSEGSILHVSVEACSLALFGRTSRNKDIEMRAGQSYGQALTLLKEATANPDVFAEDDTLMAVLVLDFFQVSAALVSKSHCSEV